MYEETCALFWSDDRKVRIMVMPHILECNSCGDYVDASVYGVPGFNETVTEKVEVPRDSSTWTCALDVYVAAEKAKVRAAMRLMVALAEFAAKQSSEK